MYFISTMLSRSAMKLANLFMVFISTSFLVFFNGCLLLESCSMLSSLAILFPTSYCVSSILVSKIIIATLVSSIGLDAFSSWVPCFGSGFVSMSSIVLCISLLTSVFELFSIIVKDWLLVSLWKVYFRPQISLSFFVHLINAPFNQGLRLGTSLGVILSRVEHIGH